MASVSPAARELKAALLGLTVSTPASLRLRPAGTVLLALPSPTLKLTPATLSLAVSPTSRSLAPLSKFKVTILPASVAFSVSASPTVGALFGVTTVFTSA